MYSLESIVYAVDDSLLDLAVLTDLIHGLFQRPHKAGIDDVCIEPVEELRDRSLIGLRLFHSDDILPSPKSLNVSLLWVLPIEVLKKV